MENLYHIFHFPGSQSLCTPTRRPTSSIFSHSPWRIGGTTIFRCIIPAPTVAQNATRCLPVCYAQNIEHDVIYLTRKTCAGSRDDGQQGRALLPGCQNFTKKVEKNCETIWLHIYLQPNGFILIYSKNEKVKIAGSDVYRWLYIGTKW